MLLFFFFLFDEYPWSSITPLDLPKRIPNAEMTTDEHFPPTSILREGIRGGNSFLAYHQPTKRVTRPTHSNVRCTLPRYINAFAISIRPLSDAQYFSAPFGELGASNSIPGATWNGSQSEGCWKARVLFVVAWDCADCDSALSSLLLFRELTVFFSYAVKV